MWSSWMKNIIVIISIGATVALGGTPLESGAGQPKRSLRGRSTVWSAHAKRRLQRPSRARQGTSIRRWKPALFRGRLKKRTHPVRRIAPGTILNALRRRVRATWDRMLVRGNALAPAVRMSLAKMNARVLGLLGRLEGQVGQARKSVLRELRQLSDRAKVVLRTRKPRPRRR